MSYSRFHSLLVRFWIQSTWLPRTEEVFRNEREGYLWTTVHLSGTIEQQQQDLSPRIIEALKESPGDFLALVFRLLGEWLKNTFGAE